MRAQHKTRASFQPVVRKQWNACDRKQRGPLNACVRTAVTDSSTHANRSQISSAETNVGPIDRMIQ